MSRACMFKWHKRFSEGRESVKDDDRPGRARTAVFLDIRGIVMAEWGTQRPDGKSAVLH